ncbi:MAG TPA: YceI family protein [Kiritimatiellia bacterium]|nr:YceI family protein [Kiritimatiellia bacterium]HMP32712.1 YceI family protein [Kiritimatiellia bacterium]
MHKSLKKSFALLMTAGMLGSFAQAATYKLDAAHTTIGFSVRHMMVSNVKGSFGEFEGTIEFDENDPSSMKASAVIQVASIDTANEKRDDHLRNEDFFDAPQFPTITFETTRVEGELPNLTLVGNLTMKGVTKEVSIPVEVGGPITNPWGSVIIGLSGGTTINRQDFGLTWSKALDGGGVVVGDQVRLILEIEAIKQ